MSMSLHSVLIFSAAVLLSLQMHSISSQSTLCRSSCGAIPIKYPLSIDDGCGSPYYRHMLVCQPNSTDLRLRTPSGTYTVKSISYTDPHLVISDPSMWTCHSDVGKPAPPFSLDTSTRFSLSPKNEFLFLNCQEDSVIIQPKPKFCERFPERCDSACDSSAYLCRNMPAGCMDALIERRMSCCSYYPKASASLRMMLSHCEGYTSVYWKDVESSFGVYDQAPEFGVRVDFEIPVTTRCLRCRDEQKGGGACGFDTADGSFLCLCKEGNVTTFCGDGSFTHRRSAGLIAGTVTVVSFAGVAGIGAFVWYLKKMRTNKVTCGVQTNENRFF